MTFKSHPKEAELYGADQATLLLISPSVGQLDKGTAASQGCFAWHYQIYWHPLPYASSWCPLLLNRPCLGGVRSQLLWMWSWTSVFFRAQELRLESGGKTDSPLKTVHLQVCGTRTWVLVSDRWVYESTFATSQLCHVRWIPFPPPAPGSLLYYGNCACLTDVPWEATGIINQNEQIQKPSQSGAWYNLLKRVFGITCYQFSVLWVFRKEGVDFNVYYSREKNWEPSSRSCRKVNFISKLEATLQNPEHLRERDSGSDRPPQRLLGRGWVNTHKDIIGRSPVLLFYLSFLPSSLAILLSQVSYVGIKVTNTHPYPKGSIHTL